MPCLEELKARGTTWNAQWKGLTGHLFGIEKKCVGKILWMHPSLGPGPCSTNWKMYKNTGLEQIKTSQKYPTHQQLYAKNTSVSLTQHHPYVQLHLAKRCLWCPPPRNLYFIMPRMEEGSHWIQTPAWMCYYLTCVITLAKKNLLFTPTSVRRCKRNVCGAPGPNIPLTWTGTAAVWNPRLGGGQWRTTQHKTVLNDNASVFNI